jgi:NAD(P)-dependent dehydrogenase (short-subunit alcohol dehydrogenase family)
VNAIAPGFVITPMTKAEYGEETELREQIKSASRPAAWPSARRSSAARSTSVATPRASRPAK